MLQNKNVVAFYGSQCSLIEDVDLYRVQLAACVSSIIKSDYPDKWPGIAEKIVTNLESDKHDTWLGTLICLYQLVKSFE